jgi:hypothetical protein
MAAWESPEVTMVIEGRLTPGEVIRFICLMALLGLGIVLLAAQILAQLSPPASIGHAKGGSLP